MGTRRGVRAVVGGLLVGVVLLGVLKLFVFEVERVSSPSMAPALLEGDWILVDRIGWRRHGAERGGVVVFVSPYDSEILVKRIVGLPGDEVVDDGLHLTINGVAVPTEPVGETSIDAAGDPVVRPIQLPERLAFREQLGSHRAFVLRLREGRKAGGHWRVPPDSLFLLGDNRDASLDSRDEAIGMVPLSAVMGRVPYILFSKSPTGWRARRWLAVP